jgi:cell division protease FtsH
MDKLHIMAELLLQYETIDAHQINDIMAGREPGPPADWTKNPPTSSTPPPPPPPKSDAGQPIGKVGDPAAQNRSGL